MQPATSSDTFRHLDQTCFLPEDNWPGAGSPSSPACGVGTGSVTLALEATTCPRCRALYQVASAAGRVRLVPHSQQEHEVRPVDI